MSKQEDLDLFAPEGMVWVCGACGKTSGHMYGHGYAKAGSTVQGWDESCMLNCSLFKEDLLIRDKETKRVIKIEEESHDDSDCHDPK